MFVFNCFDFENFVLECVLDQVFEKFVYDVYFELFGGMGDVYLDVMVWWVMVYGFVNLFVIGCMCFFLKFSKVK